MPKIGALTATTIVVANMVGTGVFTSLGFQIAAVDSVFALLMLWLVGGLIALTGALSYGELGAALPRSGGEYHLLSSIYHPFVGFLAGWVSILIGFSAPTALASMAMASYFTQAFPGINETLFSSLVVLGLSFIHASNLKAGSYFQVATTLLKVLLILTFIGAGLALSDPQPVDPVPSASGWMAIFTPAFAVSLIYASYSFSGWNASVYIAGEIKKPGRNIPVSLILGTLIITVLYLALNFVFLYASPLEEMEGKIEVGFIAARYIFGPEGGRVMATIISLLLVSTVSAMIWIGPRVAQTMGEDYRAFKFLSKKNKNSIPVRAIWFQCAVTLILIITSTFEAALVYSGFVLNCFTTLAVIGVFVMRIRRPDMPRPYKVWGYPVTPAIFVLASGWTLTFLLVDKTLESVLGLLTVAVGGVVYWVAGIGRR